MNKIPFHFLKDHFADKEDPDVDAKPRTLLANELLEGPRMQHVF